MEIRFLLCFRVIGLSECVGRFFCKKALLDILQTLPNEVANKAEQWNRRRAERRDKSKNQGLP